MRDRWGPRPGVRVFCVVFTLTGGALGCDGNEPTDMAPVTSTGARRQSLFKTTKPLAAGAAGEMIWSGPKPELAGQLIGLSAFVQGPPGVNLSIEVAGTAGVLTQAADPERSINRVIRGGRGLSVQIPNTSAALPLAPPYTFRVVREDGGAEPVNITFQVWGKFPPASDAGVPPVVAPGAGQILSVRFVMAGWQGNPERLEGVLSRARDIWRAAGVEIVAAGRTQLDQGVAARSAHLVIDPLLQRRTPALGELLMSSQLVPGDDLLVFMIQDFDTAAGLSIWALSGGIPVPPAHGTPQSGIVFSGTLVERDPGYAGQVLAHEIGHALGLFHTTEAPVGTAGTVHDGLSDTPDCLALRDANQDGQLSAEECKDGDGRNLMFWAVPRGATGLSPGQGEIARRSLLTE